MMLAALREGADWRVQASSDNKIYRSRAGV